MSKRVVESPGQEASGPQASGHEPDGERLQKVLAGIGIGSRRHCDELIADGRVRIDGQVAKLGARVDPSKAKIALDGVTLGVKPGLVYYLLNKPAGVITSASDPQGRPLVVDLVPASPRVFAVGRLDYETEGLILLTNDGDLAYRCTHPAFGLEKEYLAHVEGKPSAATVRRLREGVELEDGKTAPAKVSLLSPGLLRITIHEGRNRQVRRMCEAVGHPILRLVRSRIGPILDRSLVPKQWRNLSQSEVRALEVAVSKAARTPINRASTKVEHS